MSSQGYPEQGYLFYLELLPRKILVQNLISFVANETHYLDAINAYIQRSNQKAKTDEQRVILLQNTGNKKIIPDTYHDDCAVIVDEKLQNYSDLESMDDNAVLIDLKTLNYIFINLDRSQRIVLQKHYKELSSIKHRWKAAKAFIDKIIAEPHKQNEHILKLTREVFNDETLKKGHESSHLIFPAHVYMNNVDIDEDGDKRPEQMIIITNHWNNPSAYTGATQFHHCTLTECQQPHNFKDIGSTSVIILPKQRVCFFLGDYEREYVENCLLNDGEQQQYKQRLGEAKNIYNQILTKEAAFCQIIEEERRRIYLHRARAAADIPSGCTGKPATPPTMPGAHTAPARPRTEPFASVDKRAEIALPLIPDLAVPPPSTLPTSAGPNPVLATHDPGSALDIAAPRSEPLRPADPTDSPAPTGQGTRSHDRPPRTVRWQDEVSTSSPQRTLGDQDDVQPHQTDPGCFQRVKNTLTGAKDTVSGAFGSVGAKARGLGTTLAEKAGRAKNSAAKKFHSRFGVGASCITKENDGDLGDFATTRTPPDSAAVAGTLLTTGLLTSDQARPADQLHDTNYLSSKRGIKAIEKTGFMSVTLHVLTSTITKEIIDGAETHYQTLATSNPAEKHYINSLKKVINTLDYNNANGPSEYDDHIERSQLAGVDLTIEHLKANLMAELLHNIVQLPKNIGKKKNINTVEGRTGNPLSLLVSTVTEPEMKRRKDRKAPRLGSTDDNVGDIAPCDVGTLYFALLESLSIWKSKQAKDYKIKLERIIEIDLKNLEFVDTTSHCPPIPSNKTKATRPDPEQVDVSSENQNVLEVVSSLPSDRAYSEIPTITLPGPYKNQYQHVINHISLQEELNSLLRGHVTTSIKLKAEHLRNAGVKNEVMGKIRTQKLLNNKKRTITNARKKVVIKAHTNQLKLITIHLPSPVLPINEQDEDYKNFLQDLNATTRSLTIQRPKTFMYGKRTAQTLFNGSETITIPIQDQDDKKLKNVVFKLKAVIYAVGRLDEEKNYHITAKDIHHVALIKQRTHPEYNPHWCYFDGALSSNHPDTCDFESAHLLSPNLLEEGFPEFIILEKNYVVEGDGLGDAAMSARAPEPTQSPRATPPAPTLLQAPPLPPPPPPPSLRPQPQPPTEKTTA